MLQNPASLPAMLPQLRNALLYAFVLVAASHFAIDGALARWTAGRREKTSRGGDPGLLPEDDSLRTLFAGGAAHLGVLFIVLVLLSPQAPIPYPFAGPVELIRIWVAAISFLLVLQPGGMLVGGVIRSWRDDADAFQEGSLDKAGRLIGYVERVLVVTFILVNQYTAIGFFIAAKGLFRINDPKRSEYIIVGTLVSFAIAVLIGAAAAYLIYQGGIEQCIEYLSELLQIS